MLESIMEKAVGPMLREWRTRRRLSQYDLAGEAHVSSRHLSFIETGRTQPSRDMVLLLAEHLNIPLRERNILLIAAGYAPAFSQKTLADSSLDAVRQAVDLVLAGHEPFPALAVDRSWNLVAANRAVAPLLQGVDAALLEAPANVLRLSLHPAGLASRIVNYEQWRAHILERLRQQIEVSADAVLIELFKELSAYPIPPNLRNSISPSNELAGRVSKVMLRGIGLEQAAFQMCENHKKRLSEVWMSPHQKEWHNGSREATLSLQSLWSPIFVRTGL